MYIQPIYTWIWLETHKYLHTDLLPCYAWELPSAKLRSVLALYSKEPESHSGIRSNGMDYSQDLSVVSGCHPPCTAWWHVCTAKTWRSHTHPLHPSQGQEGQLAHIITHRHWFVASSLHCYQEESHWPLTQTYFASKDIFQTQRLSYQICPSRSCVSS